MKNLRTRKQIRLKDYDYSRNGFYFITVCTKNRACIFGDIPVGADGCPPAYPPADMIGVQLNDFGIIVDEELKKSQIIRKEIILGQYVVMPNHVHCIIAIENKDRDTDHQIITGLQISGRQIPGRQPSAPTAINRKRSLSSFVQGFKSAVTARINTLRNMPGEPVWQRSFHDHIIRSERSLNAIRKYIARNPINWEQDIDNLINL